MLANALIPLRLWRHLSRRAAALKGGKREINGEGVSHGSKVVSPNVNARQLERSLRCTRPSFPCTQVGRRNLPK